MEHFGPLVGRLTLSAAPAAEPVSLAEARAYLRFTATNATEDALITAAILEARKFGETKMMRQFVTATWVYTLDRFPDGNGRIYLPRPPLQSVSSVAYTDSAGDAQTLTVATQCKVEITEQPGYIMPVINTQWPATYDMPGSVVITFVAGYGAAAAVPEIIKTDIQRYVLAVQQRVHPELMVAMKRSLFNWDAMTQVG